MLIPKSPIARRKTLEEKNVTFRTFDPNDRYFNLFKIDPKKEFEVEFSHKVEYDFYLDIIEKSLLITGINYKYRWNLKYYYIKVKNTP